MIGARGLFELLGVVGRIRCVDAGALAVGEGTDPWVELARAGLAEIVGFEPIAEECERLNASVAGTPITYLPCAIGDGGTHTLHVTNVPMTSSIFPPESATLDLFANLGELTRVVKEIPAATRRLDDIGELGRVDFLKMDIQGAELMSLRNATRTLENVSVLQTEVEFVELYKGQPLFADVDTFLRSQGFCFLKFVYTMGRPFKPLSYTGNPNQSISQTLWGDAVYVKDFRVRERHTDRVLKSGAFVLHELYRAYDLANLFLLELDRRHGTTLSRDYLAALLATS